MLTPWIAVCRRRETRTRALWTSPGLGTKYESHDRVGKCVQAVQSLGTLAKKSATLEHSGEALR